MFFFVTIDTIMFFFFFFQAEDGIRDPLVTGVQTCALPISRPYLPPRPSRRRPTRRVAGHVTDRAAPRPPRVPGGTSRRRSPPPKRPTGSPLRAAFSGRRRNERPHRRGSGRAPPQCRGSPAGTRSA